MTDEDKQNDYRKEQGNTNDNNISLLIEQIYEELIEMRQDDLQLTEQLTSLYQNLCYLRQTLTNPQMNSTTDMSIIPIQIDCLTANRYHSKPRSDSEPNILSDRHRIITIVEDFQ